VKPIQFHPVAQAEFHAAEDYYEERVEGLGSDFADEVRSALKVIQSGPHRWPIRTQNTRSYFIHRFPFAVIYLDLPDTIWVVAIAHLHRRPGYWKRRL
jgi:toxin ParE1/3/4